MTNNMGMDKDLSTFGESTYSEENPTKKQVLPGC